MAKNEGKWISTHKILLFTNKYGESIGNILINGNRLDLVHLTLTSSVRITQFLTEKHTLFAAIPYDKIRMTFLVCVIQKKNLKEVKWSKQSLCRNFPWIIVPSITVIDFSWFFYLKFVTLKNLPKIYTALF